MTKYYNHYYITALVFESGDKVFLDSLDIYTTYPSAKLLYYQLGLYIVEK